MLHHFDRLWSISAGCARSCSVLINLCQLFPFFHFFPCFLLFSSFFFFFFFLYFLHFSGSQISFLSSFSPPKLRQSLPFPSFSLPATSQTLLSPNAEDIAKGRSSVPLQPLLLLSSRSFSLQSLFFFLFIFNFFFFFFFFESLILIIQQKKPTSVSSSSLSGGGLWAESEEIQDLFPRLRESPRTHLPDRILRLQWKRKKIVTMIGLRNWIENAPIEKPAQMGKPL